MQNWLQLSVCLYIFFFTTSKWWVPSDVGQISLLNKTHVQPATPLFFYSGYVGKVKLNTVFLS